VCEKWTEEPSATLPAHRTAFARTRTNPCVVHGACSEISVAVSACVRFRVLTQMTQSCAVDKDQSCTIISHSQTPCIACMPPINHAHALGHAHTQNAGNFFDKKRGGDDLGGRPAHHSPAKRALRSAVTEAFVWDNIRNDFKYQDISDRTDLISDIKLGVCRSLALALALPWLAVLPCTALHLPPTCVAIQLPCTVHCVAVNCTDRTDLIAAWGVSLTSTCTASLCPVAPPCRALFCPAIHCIELH
jgi:hypothetical protein